MLLALVLNEAFLPLLESKQPHAQLEVLCLISNIVVKWAGPKRGAHALPAIVALKI